MANVLIKLATTMLLITVGRIMGNRDTDGSGVASVSISLLVGLHEQCTANSEGITNDVIGQVIQMCNCTVISSLLECCVGDHAVYRFTLSRNSVLTKFDSVSTHDNIMMLQQCYYGNCTCDSSTTSSDNQQMRFLILATICGGLLFIILLTLLVICYKCYRLHHQGEKVISMTPCPPSNISRQTVECHRPAIIGSSEYIAPAEIASPTFPQTLHHGNNHSCRELANDSVTLIKQSTTVDQQQSTTDDQQSTTTDLQSTTNNMHMGSSVNSSTIIHQQEAAAAADRTLSSDQKCMVSLLHGKVTTPSGLVATIKVPTLNGAIETDIISSRDYPGYVEHTINDTHL